MKKISKTINRNNKRTPHTKRKFNPFPMNSTWPNSSSEKKDRIQTAYPTSDIKVCSEYLQSWTHTQFSEASGDYTVNVNTSSNSQIQKQITVNHDIGDHEYISEYICTDYQSQPETKDNYNISDNRDATSIESSDNQYTDIEVIKPNAPSDWEGKYDEEITTFEQDCDAENRVIWIYSFKNKPDDDGDVDGDDVEQDYEINMNIEDTNTGYVHEFGGKDKPVTKQGNERVATPAPPHLVSKLGKLMDRNLPTVAEINEGTTTGPDTQSQGEISRKSFNCWSSESSEVNNENPFEDKIKESSVEIPELLIKNSVADWVGNRKEIYTEDSGTQTHQINITDSILPNSALVTDTVSTQTKLTMALHPETRASNQTFVISIDEDPRISHRKDTGDQNVLKRHKSFTRRHHSAPKERRKSPLTNIFKNNWVDAVTSTKEKRPKDDETSRTLRRPWSNPSGRFGDVETRGKSRSANSTTCKLMLSSPMSSCEYTAPDGSTRSTRISLGDDFVVYRNPPWWHRMLKCFICK